MVITHNHTRICAQAHTACPALQLAVSNPDNVFLRDCISAVKWLGLAFYFTEDAKYAQQAKERVTVFFLDSKTGMLPTLQFAQSIPGAVKGRAQVQLLQSCNGCCDGCCMDMAMRSRCLLMAGV